MIEPIDAGFGIKPICLAAVFSGRTAVLREGTELPNPKNSLAPSERARAVAQGR